MIGTDDRAIINFIVVLLSEVPSTMLDGGGMYIHVLKCTNYLNTAYQWPKQANLLRHGSGETTRAKQQSSMAAEESNAVSHASSLAL